VLLPDDATQVFLEIQLNTSGTVVPRYNLSVAIGFPYEIDITMFENENTTTTTMATETLTTTADAQWHTVGACEHARQRARRLRQHRGASRR
jgi:hypothetical protein